MLLVAWLYDSNVVLMTWLCLVISHGLYQDCALQSLHALLMTWLCLVMEHVRHMG